MEIQSVQRVVRDVRLRLTRNLLLHSLCVSFFWAAIGFSLAVPLFRLICPPFALGWFAGAGLGLGLIFGAWRAWSRFPTALAAAVAADETFGLKEEISTAWGLRQGTDSMADAVLQRAETAASRLKTRGSFPFRPPWEGKYLPLPLVASVILVLIFPEIDLFGLEKERKEEKTTKADIEATAQDLTKRLKKLKKKKDPLLFSGAKQVIEDMEQVAATLKRHVADEKEALARLSELEQKLQKQKKDSKLGGTKKAFRPKSAAAKSDSEMVKKLLKSLREGGKEKAAETLFNQLKAMKDAFGKEGLNAEKVRGMARELKALMRAFDFPPEVLEKLRKLASALDKAGKQGEGSKFKVPPPELDFTMEELLELLKKLKEEDFLNQALRDVEGARQALIEKLKLCPYCKKGLKHPWEGGKPLPGMGPGGEPGVGYI
ncbi:MAG: hypothetical protein ACYTHN_16985 [Planctomycetota bacterium]